MAEARDGGALVDRESALMARATEPITIGWGIILRSRAIPSRRRWMRGSFRRRPGRGGPARVRDLEDFLNHAHMQTKRTLGPMRDAVAIVRGVLGGEPFEYEGETWSAPCRR